MQTQEKYACCVRALKEYVSSAGFEDVVIGLSGGIDSAVTAAMCVDAFGADHVIGVLLPGPYSSDHSVVDALALADGLGIHTEQVSITGPFEAFAAALEPVCGESFQGLPSENTQARCRMVVLMALSNALHCLLINTGNKSEAMMGYSTLYGDTAGAFAPLGGLYKTDVYAVGRWRNQCSEEELEGIGVHASPDVLWQSSFCAAHPIPENTFTKPPSAELSPGQEDEKSLGIDYAMLDAMLISLFERGLSVEETAVATGAAVEEVQRIRDRGEYWAFKRALEPPFPQDPFYSE